MKHKPFIVASEQAILALPKWLSELHCNTYGHDAESRITVGYQAGRRYSYTASIYIKYPYLFDRALETVRSALSIG